MGYADGQLAFQLCFLVFEKRSLGAQGRKALLLASVKSETCYVWIRPADGSICPEMHQPSAATSYQGGMHFEEHKRAPGSHCWWQSRLVQGVSWSPCFHPTTTSPQPHTPPYLIHKRDPVAAYIGMPVTHTHDSQAETGPISDQIPRCHFFVPSLLHVGNHKKTSILNTCFSGMIY